MTHDFPVLDRLGGLCEDRTARGGRMSEGMEGIEEKGAEREAYSSQGRAMGIK